MPARRLISLGLGGGVLTPRSCRPRPRTWPSCSALACIYRCGCSCVFTPICSSPICSSPTPSPKPETMTTTSWARQTMRMTTTPRTKTASTTSTTKPVTMLTIPSWASTTKRDMLSTETITAPTWTSTTKPETTTSDGTTSSFDAVFGFRVPVALSFFGDHVRACSASACSPSSTPERFPCSGAALKYMLESLLRRAVTPDA
mmetsp:Transcript_23325/g.73101  ORF Transcript_23325/g.73101 Transcript_23325/m.73101 type:complete len:202 (-) Transcript_23325:280-885(-)